MWFIKSVERRTQQAQDRDWRYTGSIISERRGGEDEHQERGDPGLPLQAENNWCRGLPPGFIVKIIHITASGFRLD